MSIIKETEQISPARKSIFALAPILEYPEADFEKRLQTAISSSLAVSPACAAPLLSFKEKIASLRSSDLEELYTRTFDLAPICIPYLSSHIYGDENFERGALMSRLSERYEECAFDTHGELPDHLALILRFAPQFEPDEFNELVEFCLRSALEKMLESLKDADNPYYLVLNSASELIESEREGLIL